jgi:hypothetical protein
MRGSAGAGRRSAGSISWRAADMSSCSPADGRFRISLSTPATFRIGRSAPCTEHRALSMSCMTGVNSALMAGTGKKACQLRIPYGVLTRLDLETIDNALGNPLASHGNLRSYRGNHQGTTENQIHGTMRKHHNQGNACRNEIVEAEGMSMNPVSAGTGDFISTGAKIERSGTRCPARRGPRLPLILSRRWTVPC